MSADNRDAGGASPMGQRPSAVAIAYDTADTAPRVVAKGYGTVADNIMRVARDNGLYIHESPELVGLLMQVDLDKHIPPELYEAVAQLLAWLYKLEAASASGASEP
ncbi:MAG TPA: EscU/YscU/HrcU family type III secretion system export apparatus switch protein [Pusillimonas sp.]|uniref:EscU/YscU/HrcU family type III secretion system export apparatus switch protein n=1 Tax=unclassified Pusillimonas TaxID=2640016 RepID=UPI00262C6BC0|nr:MULTISPECIES: EscU/YscU/HrcU family type III secretion system export apparatus switch protein [unclassified Pusillimonas]HLU18562.1 EscU/YscU/HrcU family type III secretion system export apparatus switch protein [Pusillimonas sp.]